MTNSNDDPIYTTILAHRTAYAAADKAMREHLDILDDPVAKEKTRAAFTTLVTACRRLLDCEFTTVPGLVALLNYMAAGLSEPGAPSMPLEVVFDGQWETAFGAFCSNLAKSTTALMTEIDRLRVAKRRALQLANERAKEANELRAQLAELRGQRS